MKTQLPFIILLLSCPFWIGCGEDDPAAPVVQAPVDEDGDGVFDHVVNMDQQDVALLGVEGATYRYRIDGDRPDLAAGDLIVAQGDPAKGAVDAALPDTYLRRVVAVDEDGPYLVVRTADAAVTEAVDCCDLSGRIPLALEEPDHLLPGVSVTEDGLLLEDLVLWDGDFVYYWDSCDPEHPLTGHLEARVDAGFIRIDEPALDWSFAVDGARFRDFSNVYEGRVALGCDVSVNAAHPLYWTTDLLEVYRKTQRQVTTTGCFPVVHVVTTTVTLEFDIEVAGPAEVRLEGLGAEYDVASGAIFADGAWSHDNVSERVLDESVPDLDDYARLKIKPYAVIEIEDRFYGVGGPKVRAEPYVLAETSDGAGQWCLDVDVGCNVGCCASLGILDAALDRCWGAPDWCMVGASIFSECWSD